MTSDPLARLRDMLAAHRAEPFPAAVDGGADHGQVDAVTIGADVYGWATWLFDGRTFTTDDRARFRGAADELAASLGAFPPTARPYYARLVGIAETALALIPE